MQIKIDLWEEHKGKQTWLAYRLMISVDEKCGEFAYWVDGQLNKK